MKETADFQDIGKKMPYHVPDGFFGQIAEKTLQLAKQREQNRKRKLVLWRTVVVVTSMAAVLLLAVFIPRHNGVMESRPLAQNNVHLKKQLSIVQTIKKTVSKKESTVENNSEDIATVLAGLSDDELLQLTESYQSDPFMDESSQ